MKNLLEEFQNKYLKEIPKKKTKNYWRKLRRMARGITGDPSEIFLEIPSKVLAEVSSRISLGILEETSGAIVEDF